MLQRDEGGANSKKKRRSDLHAEMSLQSIYYLLLNCWQKNVAVTLINIEASYVNSLPSLSKRSMTEDSVRTAYFCTFPVAFVGFAQALSGLPAARGGVEGRHHLTGSVAQAPLYTVGVIQLLHLQEPTLHRAVSELTPTRTALMCFSCPKIKLSLLSVRSFSITEW